MWGVWNGILYPLILLSNPGHNNVPSHAWIYGKYSTFPLCEPMNIIFLPITRCLGTLKTCSPYEWNSTFLLCLSFTYKYRTDVYYHLLNLFRLVSRAYFWTWRIFNLMITVILGFFIFLKTNRSVQLSIISCKNLCSCPWQKNSAVLLDLLPQIPEQLRPKSTLILWSNSDFSAFFLYVIVMFDGNTCACILVCNCVIWNRVVGIFSIKVGKILLFIDRHLREFTDRTKLRYFSFRVPGNASKLNDSTSCTRSKLFKKNRNKKIFSNLSQARVDCKNLNAL